MKKLIMLLLTLVPFITKAQMTLIPDQEFEQRLILLNIDSDGVINGQLLTSDALAATNLNLLGTQIANFSGLNDFINLEILNLGYLTYLSTLNYTNLTNLKELYFDTSDLNTFDVTPLTALEELEIDDTSADSPISAGIRELDFSNSINFKSLYIRRLQYLELINMRNNVANSVNILINQGENTCIEVDDHIAATNGLPPYDTWSITVHGPIVSHPNYYFSDVCTLSIEKFVKDNFKIYPNPTTDYVSIEQKTTTGVTLQSVQILDSSGKWIKSVKDNFNQIDVSNLSKGMYLFVIQTDKGNKTEKIVIQ